MREYIIFCITFALILASNVFGQATGGDDNYYNTKIYTAMGGDSTIVKDGGKIIIRTGGQVVGGIKLAITADTIIVKSGGYLIINSGGAVNAADKIATTDTIQIGTGAYIYVASGGRIWSDGLVDADTINADSIRAKTSRIDTVWIDKVAKIDSVRFLTAKGDTAWITTLLSPAGSRITSNGRIDADTVNIDSIKAKTAKIDTIWSTLIVSSTYSIVDTIIHADSVYSHTSKTDTAWITRGIITASIIDTAYARTLRINQIMQIDCTLSVTAGDTTGAKVGTIRFWDDTVRVKWKSTGSATWKRLW